MQGQSVCAGANGDSSVVADPLSYEEQLSVYTDRNSQRPQTSVNVNLKSGAAVTSLQLQFILIKLFKLLQNFLELFPDVLTVFLNIFTALFL